MSRANKVLILFLVLALIAAAALGQPNRKSRIKQQTPTVYGSTGLFTMPTADTLREGEFSFGAWSHHFNREPGDIDVNNFPLTFAVGLLDRVEFFASWEVYKRVHADHIAIGTFNPAFPPQATQLPNGQTAFWNDSPFMDTGFGDAGGNVTFGVKFGLMSEHFGDPVGIAIQPVLKLATTSKTTRLLRGLTSGRNDYGVDFILSKYANRGTFTSKIGVRFAEDYGHLDRQNELGWGFGYNHPFAGDNVHFIAEYTGTTYWGSRTLIGNPKAPNEVHLGFRAFPARWMTIGGGYNLYMNRIDPDNPIYGGIEATDRHGWIAHAIFSRKVNRPPVITCEANPTSIEEGDSVNISADVNDPDDDVVTVTWKSTAGRLTQNDATATWDSTGLDEGTYTVLAEVTDGDNIAACSSDIVITKRKLPPVIQCGTGSASVQAGQSTSLRATASDPNNDPLTYSWTVNGQTVQNDSADFEFGTAGRQPGTYRVAVTVTDVDGMTATCEFTVTVTRRPNVSPTCSLTLNPTSVYAGETVTATATANDPDGDRLSYAYTRDGRSVAGSGATISINTAGMAGGSHTVALTVRDARGATCTDTKTFNVRERITIQMDGTTPNNIAKAQLDEIALKLQQNPSLRMSVTGHTDDRGSETANERVGLRRAEALRDYLVEQHNIDPNRIETASAGESEPVADNQTAEGRKQNRRAVVELFVP